jgi:hypothetical protein
VLSALVQVALPGSMAASMMASSATHEHYYICSWMDLTNDHTSNENSGASVAASSIVAVLQSAGAAGLMLVYSRVIVLEMVRYLNIY